MSWEMVEISKVANVITGTTPSKSNNEFYEGGDIPFVTPRELGANHPIHKATTYLTDKGFLKANVVPKFSILVCCIGSIGKMGIAGREIATNQQINSVVFDSSLVDYRYGYRALSNVKSTMINSASSTTIAILNKSNFERIKIPLPPLPEQQRIADILDKAEAINQKREQALVLCDEFLRATFLDMFGDPVSNPKGWEVEKLDEVISSIKAGKSLAGDSKPANKNELGVLKVSAVSYGFFKPQENKKIEKVVDREKLIFPKKGDFLFSRANTRELVGATCIVQDDFEHVFLPDKLWLIDVDSEKVSAYYLHFLMLEPKFKDKLTSQATGTSGSMLNISQKKFVNTIAPIPPIELQQKFSSIVEKVDAIKARIQHAQELPLFDALSQQAFKGELTQ